MLAPPATRAHRLDEFAILRAAAIDLVVAGTPGAEADAGIVVYEAVIQNVSAAENHGSADHESVRLDLAILHQRPVGVLVAVDHRPRQVGAGGQTDQVPETGPALEDGVGTEVDAGMRTRLENLSHRLGRDAVDHRLVGIVAAGEEDGRVLVEALLDPLLVIDRSIRDVPPRGVIANICVERFRRRRSAGNPCKRGQDPRDPQHLLPASPWAGPCNGRYSFEHGTSPFNRHFPGGAAPRTVMPLIV